MTRRLAAALAAAAVLAAATPAPAFDLGLGLFKRRAQPSSQTTPPKNDPAVRVKQGIAAVQSDPDVNHRMKAVEDLGAFDPRTYADLVPTLVAALQNDPSPSVRALAAETIGGYRTIYDTAASALESADAADPDKGVRAAARSALWQYHIGGYKPAAAAPNSQTAEPPLAKPAKLTTRPTTAGKPTEVQFRPVTQGGANPPATIPPAGVPQPTLPAFSVPQRMPERVEVLTPERPTAVLPPLPDRTVITTTPLPELKGNPRVVPPAAAKPVVPPADTSLPLPLPSVPEIPGGVPTVVPPRK